MKTMLFASALLVNLLPVNAIARSAPAKFDFFCYQLLQSKPSLQSYETAFAKEFIDQVPREAVGHNGVPLENPTLILELEWFATTSENCKAMFYLHSLHSPEVRSILSKSVPGLKDLGKADSHWAYAGYKGGSEPGVISMTYLLQSKKGTKACLSMSWNNSETSVSSFRFQDFVQKTLKYGESRIP